MQISKKGILTWIICLMVLLPTVSMAIQTRVNGHIESRAVLRDVDGFQSGFLNDYNEFIALRSEIKIDVLLKPEYVKKPALRFEKANMIYKGAYDAIFDVTDRYNNVPVNVDSSEFEVGRDDLRFTNDLQEIYADFVYQTRTTNTSLRLRRQVLIWGEDIGHAISNNICPMDLRFATLGSNFEEVVQSLWMVRFDHSAVGVGPFNQVGIELVMVPENRPHQMALGSDANGPNEWWTAPYAFGFEALNTGLGVTEIQEVVPSSGTENMSFGAMLGLDINGYHFDTSYYIGYSKAFNLNLGNPVLRMVYQQVMGLMGLPTATDSASIAGNMAILGGIPSIGPLVGAVQDLEAAGTLTTVFAEHPKHQAIAFSGNFYSDVAEGIIAFEFGYNDNMGFGHVGDGGLKSYAMYDVWQGYIAYEKPIRQWQKHLGTNDPISATYSAYHRYIASYDDDTSGDGAHQNNTSLQASFMGSWDAGRLKPMVTIEYDTEGVWYTNITVTLVRGRWYFSVGEQSAFGRADATAALKHRYIGQGVLSFIAGYNF